MFEIHNKITVLPLDKTGIPDGYLELFSEDEGVPVDISAPFCASPIIQIMPINKRMPPIIRFFISPYFLFLPPHLGQFFAEIAISAWQAPHWIIFSAMNAFLSAGCAPLFLRN